MYKRATPSLIFMSVYSSFNPLVLPFRLSAFVRCFPVDFLVFVQRTHSGALFFVVFVLLFFFIHSQWGVFTNMTMSCAYVVDKFAMKTNLRQYLGNPLLSAAEAHLHAGPHDHLPFEYRFSVEPATEDEPLQIFF